MTELLQFTLFGLMLGCVYAIAAMGLVLTYNISGVFNFAHGAVGMLAAFLFYDLNVERGVPTLFALLIVVFIFSPLLGLLVERIMRSFQGADFATSLVVTVALTVGLLGLAERIYDPGQARFMPQLLGENKIRPFDVPITYDQIAQVILAIGVAFGLRFLLFGTSIGARMRGVVDDPELARLHGVEPVMVARFGWVVGFVLAGLGGVLFATGQNLNAPVLTLLVLNAYGAAMIGRLTSLPMTFVGALALGLCQQLPNVSWLYPSGDVLFLDESFWLRLQLAIPGVFLILAVLLVPSARLSSGSAIGRNQPRIPTLRTSVLGGAALVAVTALLVNVLPANAVVDVQRALVYATIALSLVAVTGMSGQVSLTQFLFVGIGAFVVGKMSSADGIVSMVMGGLVAAVLGAIVALPAVRLKGLYLALSTFGAALVGRELILGDDDVFGLGGLIVPRPSIVGISTESDATYAIWCAVAFSLLAILLGVIRRSFVGRQLTAIRDSELAAATAGIPVRTAKLVIFSFAAFVAGCAGSLFGGFSAAVSGLQFEPLFSLLIVLFAYVGGITSATGALFAGVLYASLTYAQATYPSAAGAVFVVVGAAAVALGREPNGLAGIVLAKLDEFRDGIERSAPSPSDPEELSDSPVPVTAEPTVPTPVVVDQGGPV